MAAPPVTAWRSGAGERPAHVPLPPGRMPLVRARRPLKRWRYVGVFGDAVLLCAAVAHVGPLTAAWWAVWDREARTLTERTRRSARAIRLAPGSVEVRDGDVAIALELDEGPGVETVSPHGPAGYAWTRKQGGVPARGTVAAGGRVHVVDALAVVDDSAGYHARETRWEWSAGVGRSEAGAVVAWNLVRGVHDDARASERTVWVGGAAHEAGPAAFSPMLDRVTTADGGDLRFRAEAVRARREDLRLVASDYTQPFGTFAGVLPHAGAVRGALGVMERHAARW